MGIIGDAWSWFWQPIPYFREKTIEVDGYTFTGYKPEQITSTPEQTAITFDQGFSGSMTNTLTKYAGWAAVIGVAYLILRRR